MKSLSNPLFRAFAIRRESFCVPPPSTPLLFARARVQSVVSLFRVGVSPSVIHSRGWIRHVREIVFHMYKQYEMSSKKASRRKKRGKKQILFSFPRFFDHAQIPRVKTRQMSRSSIGQRMRPLPAKGGMHERVQRTRVGGRVRDQITNHEPPICPTGVRVRCPCSRFDFPPFAPTDRTASSSHRARGWIVEHSRAENIAAPFFRSIFVPFASRGSELELELGRFPPSAGVMLVRSFARVFVQLWTLRIPTRVRRTERAHEPNPNAFNNSRENARRVVAHETPRSASSSRAASSCAASRHPKIQRRAEDLF